MSAKTDVLDFDGKGLVDSWGQEDPTRHSFPQLSEINGMPSMPVVTQSLWRPLSANATLIHNGAVNLSQGDKVSLNNFRLDHPRPIVITGPTAGRFIIRGRDGWKKVQTVTILDSLRAFDRVDELEYTSSTPFVGTLTIGTTRNFGTKYPIFYSGDALWVKSAGLGAGVSPDYERDSTGVLQPIGFDAYSMSEIGPGIPVSLTKGSPTDGTTLEIFDRRGTITLDNASLGTLVIILAYIATRVVDRDSIGPWSLRGA